MYDQPDPCVDLIRDQVYEAEEAERAANMVKQRELAQRKGKREADKEEAAGRRAFTRPMSSYRPANVEWLWEQRIPIGEITMLAGKSGIGKSTVLTTFASWLTLGKMRGSYYGAPQHVIYVPNEDSVEKALMPRLMAAGADLDKVHTLHITNTSEDEECPLILPEDCERLGQAVRDLGAAAVMVDPLSSNMSDRDRNRPEVRQSYERLRRCAELNRISIVGTGHVRKGQDTNMLDALLGSSEIGNIVRAALGVLIDPDSEDRQMILSQIKNNYGSMVQRSYVYAIKERRMWTDEFGQIDSTYIDWKESTERQVNDVLSDQAAAGIHSMSDMSECKEWLRDYLQVNPGQPRKLVMRDGLKEGHKEHTIKKAGARLGVVSLSSGYPRVSSWSLPSTQSEQLEHGGTD